jgi:hypothetical protein
MFRKIFRKNSHQKEKPNEVLIHMELFFDKFSQRLDNLQQYFVEHYAILAKFADEEIEKSGLDMENRLNLKRDEMLMKNNQQLKELLLINLETNKKSNFLNTLQLFRFFKNETILDSSFIGKLVHKTHPITFIEYFQFFDPFTTVELAALVTSLKIENTNQNQYTQLLIPISFVKFVFGQYDYYKGLDIFVINSSQKRVISRMNMIESIENKIVNMFCKNRFLLVIHGCQNKNETMVDVFNLNLKLECKRSFDNNMITLPQVPFSFTESLFNLHINSNYIMAFFNKGFPFVQYYDTKFNELHQQSVEIKNWKYFVFADANDDYLVFQDLHEIHLLAIQKASDQECLHRIISTESNQIRIVNISRNSSYFISIYDNNLYVYDIFKMKWLTRKSFLHERCGYQKYNYLSEQDIWTVKQPFLKSFTFIF